MDTGFIALRQGANEEGGSHAWLPVCDGGTNIGFLICVSNTDLIGIYVTLAMMHN